MFAYAPEAAMDLHFGRSVKENEFYLVIGCRVGLLLNEDTFTDTEPGNARQYLENNWLRPGIPREARVAAFGQWLRDLDRAPRLVTANSTEAWPSFWGAMGPVVPNGILPHPPPPPPTIYGHLPFTTTTLPDTVIYRWEAFPTSRRIVRSTDPANPPTIAQGTYAAPASEVPFAVTGFAAVARFALPNLMPACFRYELQPVLDTPIECGASVPLYGQSGGGVEVKFTNQTDNRCAIADPIILPAL
jgi:hypothetical protein